MKPQEYMNTSLLDILFENRNKSYGAYIMRLEYEHNVRKAMFIGIFGCLSVVLFPSLYNFFSAGKHIDEKVRTISVQFTDFKQEDKSVKKIQPVKPKTTVEAAPAKATVAFVEPKIVENTDVDKGSVNLNNAVEVGTKNSAGTGEAILNTNSTTTTDHGTTSGDNTNTNEKKSEETPIVIVEEQASFEQGLPALYKWLGANIKYPSQCRQNGIEGKVIVRFIVEKDGTVTAPQVVRGVHTLLDNEAIRVMNLMPKWKPGKQRGNAVRSYFTLPIKFTLE